jgi:hypothetical protein
MIAWWVILYYPLIFLLLLVGRRLDKRFVADPSKRRKADTALGCAFFALLWAGFIIMIGQAFVGGSTR